VVNPQLAYFIRHKNVVVMMTNRDAIPKADEKVFFDESKIGRKGVKEAARCPLNSPRAVWNTVRL